MMSEDIQNDLRQIVDRHPPFKNPCYRVGFFVERLKAMNQNRRDERKPLAPTDLQAVLAGETDVLD